VGDITIPTIERLKMKMEQEIEVLKRLAKSWFEAHARVTDQPVKRPPFDLLVLAWQKYKRVRAGEDTKELDAALKQYGEEEEYKTFEYILNVRDVLAQRAMDQIVKERLEDQLPEEA
jgi:hypothetical protein